MIEFYWPSSTGEWFAWTSAVITIIFGLMLLFTPLLSYRIVRSSGHPTLDRAVRDMIQRAAPLPKMPRNIKNERLQLSIPIAFQLK